ncbi:MAG: DUF3488 domain-containing protein [Nitrospira sp.]|nr:DUF3488 domain-containing protein [Nitrospira sp.]
MFLLLAFAGFWIDLLLVSQELLPAGIHFLVLLLVNKLSNLDQRRDFLHLYAISLITLLASAALTTQIWYAPLLLCLSGSRSLDAAPVSPVARARREHRSPFARQPSCTA